MSKTFVAGQPAPWFHARALDGHPRYAFNTAAGRRLVLLFPGSGGHEATQGARAPGGEPRPV